MPGLYLVNVQDVERPLGPDRSRLSVQDIFERLETGYLDKRGGGFNHNTSIQCIHDVFRGAISVAQGKAYCLANGNPKGRKQNAEIVETVGHYAAANISTCYRIGFIAVAVSRFKKQTIYVGIKAPFIRVKDTAAFLVIPGFRKAARPVGWQIDLVCSLAAQQLVRDDFDTADIEYLSAGPGPDNLGRAFQALHGSDMNLLSSDAVDDCMQFYVEAVARHLELGNGNRPARLAGYRVIDPASPAFF